jgi:hypothetical protein
VVVLDDAGEYGEVAAVVAKVDDGPAGSVVVGRRPGA